ncbi:hypothetical protein HQ560_07795 [bacterium]|nr:hypothetical protein [bacterium]
MLAFYRSLPVVDALEPTPLRLRRKIAILTHDDNFDDEMYEYAREQDYRPTFFLLTSRLRKQYPADADLGLHYNKASKHTLREQVALFEDATGRTPTSNRNHRLWWRAAHLDLAHLAMHGIQIDSSQVGLRPFRPVAEQRLLPIWELPLSVCDYPYITVCGATTCTLNAAADMATLFERGVTPIVGLFHPYLKQRTRWKDFYALAADHGYMLMNVRQFHDAHLADA